LPLANLLARRKMPHPVAAPAETMRTSGFLSVVEEVGEASPAGLADGVGWGIGVNIGARKGRPSRGCPDTVEKVACLAPNNPMHKRHVGELCPFSSYPVFGLWLPPGFATYNRG
jgi:hypothetical protein